MNILVTGVTGTLGSAVTQRLLDNTEAHVFGYSRDEKKQADIKPHPRLTLILGDVRDQRRLIESSRDCEFIFHFAALKRVDTLEANPEESIYTNIEGTMNVLGAQRANKIKRVVLSSTDKACRPINVYGYCKGISEKLVLRNKNNVVVRYGNVLASRGSAVIDFVKSIQKTGEVNITHPEMTRFFLRIEDAVDYVLQAAFSRSGGLKINHQMKSCYMVDLADAIGEILGKKVKKNIIGIRPGEKLHEDLYHEYEASSSMTSYTSPRFTRGELKTLLRPLIEPRIRKTRKEISQLGELSL